MIFDNINSLNSYIIQNKNMSSSAIDTNFVISGEFIKNRYNTDIFLIYYVNTNIQLIS